MLPMTNASSVHDIEHKLPVQQSLFREPARDCAVGGVVIVSNAWGTRISKAKRTRPKPNCPPARPAWIRVPRPECLSFFPAPAKAASRRSRGTREVPPPDCPCFFQRSRSVIPSIPWGTRPRLSRVWPVRRRPSTRPEGFPSRRASFLRKVFSTFRRHRTWRRRVRN